MKPIRSLQALLVAMTVGAACLVATPQAFAAETTKVTLKDGTVVEGEVVREDDRYIMLMVRIGEVEERKFIMRRDIASVELIDPQEATADAGADDVTTPIVRTTRDDDKMIPPGATRIAYITLHEGVGSHFNRDALARSVAALDELPENEQPEILVLSINSGGGALNELEKLVPYIKDYVEPKYRTVAWIESAISAACMTAWVVDEVYMMRKAPIGGCTGFRSTSSGTVAMEGLELEEVLAWMETVSEWGKKEPLIMRAMQIFTTLSCDVDENGDVTWYESDQGEYMISPPGEVLTFNSHDAVKYGVAQGIADTKDQLAKAMGCTEWVEVGQEAGQMMTDFRENVSAAEVELFATFDKMNIALGAMNATPEPRNKKRHYGRAKSLYQSIKSTVYNRAPSLLIYGQFNERFFDYYDQVFEDIAEQLRDI